MYRHGNFSRARLVVQNWDSVHRLPCSGYLYVKCTFMSSLPLCEMYLYVKCTFMSSIPLYEMYLYAKCTFMPNEFMWNVFMSNVPLCQMSLCQMILYVKRFMWNEFMWSDFMSNITDPIIFTFKLVQKLVGFGDVPVLNRILCVKAILN